MCVSSIGKAMYTYIYIYIISLSLYIYIYIYINHLFIYLFQPQTNGECRDSIVIRVLGWDLRVLGSVPADVKLYGLRVRHFKVSGGVPSPPEQPQPVLEWKTRRVTKKQKTNGHAFRGQLCMSLVVESWCQYSV